MQPNGYGVVEIHSPGGRAQETGVRLLSELGSSLTSGLTSLKHLEKAVNDAVNPEVRSLIVFVPVGRVVYLVFHGEGVVYLKRGNQIAVLVRQSGGISGEVREGDTILLASGGFSRLLSQEDIAKFFDHDPPESVAEKLTIALHQKKDAEGSVALVYQIERFEEYESRQPELPPVVHAVVRQWIASGTTSIVNLRHRPLEGKKLLFFVLGGLFFVSIVLGVWKQSSIKTTKTIETAMSDARHSFDEGVALLPLNPVKGRERLTQAKDRLDPLVSSVNPRTQAGYKFTDLYGQIQGYLTQSMQISQGNPSLFYDMTLMKKEAIASTFALEGTTLIVADWINATVYRLDIATKNASILGGGSSVSGGTAVAFHGENVFILTPEGIVDFGVYEKKSSLVIKKDEGWGNILSVVAFGGNLYLLDTQKSRIWKYVATQNKDALNAESVPASASAVQSGFSSLREYLNPDTLPDFSGATGMSIDGTVWVGSRTGHMFHFVSGREEIFTPKGVEPAVGSDTYLYATDETKNVYVLDRQNNRVVVLDKDGTYLAQYQWTESLVVSAFVVSEAQKKILLLVSGKVFSLDLK